MTSFVLVHGGAHGAWCWDHLAPLLRVDPRVDAVVAVDLTGHGARLDVKPLESITVADYIDDVVSAIESADLRDVVLVGHSMAGITIPRAAARVAGRMRRLIYLSTTNPPVGRSIADSMRHPLSPLSRGVDFQTMFCNDVDQEMAQWMFARLGPEPPGPMNEPVVAAPVAIPSTYILLERDEALPPAFQREQASNAGADEIIPFDAGHSAFVSRPRALADLLLRYA